MRDPSNARRRKSSRASRSSAPTATRARRLLRARTSPAAETDPWRGRSPAVARRTVGRPLPAALSVPRWVSRTARSAAAAATGRIGSRRRHVQPAQRGIRCRRQAGAARARRPGRALGHGGRRLVRACPAPRWQRRGTCMAARAWCERARWPKRRMSGTQQGEWAARVGSGWSGRRSPGRR